jgi:RimJ/RimL family protein N-acetyltransferase
MTARISLIYEERAVIDRTYSCALQLYASDSMNNETRDAIHTKRLSLRSVQPDDVPALGRLMTTGVSRWLASWTSSEETIAVKILEAMRAIAAREAVHFLIERRADETPIGYVRVARVPVSRRRGDLSYWIGEGYHGQGYATEAALAATRAAFEILDLDSVEAGAQPENVASFAVMRRRGMERSEERIVHAVARGCDELCVFYSVSRERFLSISKSASK